MTRHKSLCSIVGAIALATACPTRGQSSFQSGVYQIISGSFTACCGIAGPTTTPLPNNSQSMVKLSIDSQTQLATMTFLGADATSVFTIVPCPPGDPVPFTFGFGFISSNQTVFHVDPGPPPNSEYWSLGVSNSAGALQINGTVGFAAQSCADVPNQFTYSNVVAVLMPVATIRVSEVEICWNAVSNVTYQLQYKPALTTNDWLNLGSPVTGTGATNCATDKVVFRQTQRVYRVLPMP